jgi:LacI family transcriptional regulator
MSKKRRNSTTIFDIANEAGVSASTVSRVLNNSMPVDPAKRAAVLKAVQNLNFKPNLVAQELGRGRTMTIGILIPQSASIFYNTIINGIEQGLELTPYRSLVASSNYRLEEERKLLDLLVARRVDAIVTLWNQVDETYLLEIAKEIPLISIGRKLSGLEKQCLVVSNFQGAYQATRYLIERGHTRIAHITGALNVPDGMQRFEGYKQALRDAGLEPDPQLIVEGDFEEQSGLFGVGVLFTRGVRFTALFAGNDMMAMGARLGFYRHGMRVPDDISIVGYDDQPGSAYTIPPLTTVRQPLTEIGIAAAQAALNLIENQEPNLPVLHTELLIRESVATVVRNDFNYKVYSPS